MTKWFETQKCTYLLDFQMPIGQPRTLRNLDVYDIVRRLKEIGTQCVVAHAKDNQGNAYYDTQFGHRHSGIADRDLMKEFCRACEENDVTLICYVQLARERRANSALTDSTALSIG